MSTLSRVVWSEGMHLAQHHFQAQSRYFEELIGFTVSSLFSRPYGIIACELDPDALLNGTVSLTHGRGVLPDGLVFNLPEDGQPAPLPIADLFSPTQDAHEVYLAIPAFVPGRANCGGPEANGRDPRYLPADRSVVDETTGADEKKVSVARKNFRLLLDTEVNDDLVAIPIARIRRDGSGHFVYDPEYIPPTLQIRGSRRLVELVGRLVEILEAKAEALKAERVGTEPADRRGTSEVASFWLSHAVHSAIAPLRYHLDSGLSHPEALYLDLARLAGALCTFSLTSHPRDLPAYDHDRLDRCFDALDRHIRQHLDVIIPTGTVTIPLRPSDTNLYTGAVGDRRCLDGAEWYLGVRSSAAAARVLGDVPKLVKVCSTKYIVRLVREAYPGLTLEHVATPPPEVPTRAGVHYFRVERQGPCWDSIVGTAEVGVYVPDAIPDVDLELHVVTG